MSRTHGVSEGEILWFWKTVSAECWLTNLQITLSDEVGRQINYCVRDGLLKVIKKVGSKGSKIGIEQEGYKLPEDKVSIRKFELFN